MGEPSGLSPFDGRLHRDSALIESARGDRLEILAGPGLEDDLASAQVLLGQSPKASTPRHRRARALRLRSHPVTGRPHNFVGVVSGVDGPPTRSSLTIESRGREGFWQDAAHPAVLHLLVVVAIWIGTTVFRRRVWIDSVVLLGRAHPGRVLGRASRRTWRTWIDGLGLVDTPAQATSSLIGWPPSTILIGRPRGVVYWVWSLMPMVFVMVAIRSMTPDGRSMMSTPSLSVAPTSWPLFVPPPPTTTDQLRGQ